MSSTGGDRRLLIRDLAQLATPSGTDDAAERLERVLTTDPGTGVMRHLDAGYPEAAVAAEEYGLVAPMPPSETE